MYRLMSVNKIIQDSSIQFYDKGDTHMVTTDLTLGGKYTMQYADDVTFNS